MKISKNPYCRDGHVPLKMDSEAMTTVKDQAWKILETGNLDPSGFAVDERLQELVRPYAEMAESHVMRPLGNAEGEWDDNRQFYREQTNSMDLIARACIGMTTRRIAPPVGSFSPRGTSARDILRGR